MIELASGLLADINNHVQRNNKCQLVKNDIHSLLKFPGLDSDKLADLMRLLFTHQILKTFSVGTEKSKINIPQTPSDTELIPLIRMVCRSVVTIAKDDMNININKSKQKKNRKVTPSLV